MTIVEMFEQSGILTLLGMGIVFSFLVIMIFFVSMVGKIIHALKADMDVMGPAPAAPSSGGGTGAGNAAVTAAISAAVTEYRKTTNP
ncbi:MAG: OadG family protein [Spirochaetaceae bacterium]|jgi:oxaloacetate decarboxylase gamma subunit|nr:OadG family protein [Spirochaetaceae bacterium]